MDIDELLEVRVRSTERGEGEREVPNLRWNSKRKPEILRWIDVDVRSSFGEQKGSEPLLRLIFLSSMLFRDEEIFSRARARRQSPQ